MVSWRTVLAVVFLLVAGSALGATRTWSGAGPDPKWSTAANWVEGQAPAHGDDLVFPSGALQKASHNDLPPGTIIGSVTFACLSDCVASGGGYTLAGNAIALLADIVMERGAENTIQLDVVLPIDPSPSEHRVTVETAAAGLRIAGLVSGGSQAMLVKDGPGTLRLSAANAYQGPTRVETGVLEISTSLALGLPLSGTVVSSGATLVLDGTSGPLMIDEPLDLSGAGASDRGVLVSPTGTNTVAGAVTLSATALFTVGTTAVAGDALTLTGPIGGPGGLIKGGPNALVMSGTAVNTFAGATTVRDGLLRLARLEPGVSIPRALQVGDGTGESRSAVARLEQAGQPQLASSVPVTVASDGLLDLNGFTLEVGLLMGVPPTAGQSRWSRAQVQTGAGVLILHGNVDGGDSLVVNGQLSLGAATRVMNRAEVSANIVDGGAPAGVTVTAGGLLLSGASSYTGPTTVLAGTLEFYDPLALGSPTGGTTVAAGASLAFRRSYWFDFHHFFDRLDVGAEPLVLSGSLKGYGAWAGDITIDGNASIAGYADEGYLAADRSLTVRGRVRGTGSLEVAHGSGYSHVALVGLAGAWEFVGPVVVRGNTLSILDQAAAPNAGNPVTLIPVQDQGFVLTAARVELNGFDVTTGPLTGVGIVSLGGRDSTVFTVVIPEGQSATFGNGPSGTAISGRGHVHKAGTGDWSFDGAIECSGLTVVRAGTLSLHGSVQGGAVVEKGAALNADGRVGYLEVGGVLKPTGRLETGNLLLAAGATLASDGASGVLAVTGSASVEGGTLQVAGVGFAKRFVLIDNDGTDPVVGTFAGLPEGATLEVGGTRLQVSYVGGTGNDVVLTRPDVTLTLTKTGTATGVVVSTTPPDVIDCGATCTAAVVSGTRVTLQATAGDHGDFTGWSGASCTGTGPCMVTVTGDTTVTARFDPLVVTRYLAEGATSDFFDTRLALLNPSTTATATGTVTFLRGDGTTVTELLSVPPRTRQTLDVKSVPGMAAAEFSTVVQADTRLVVDRTMTWDAHGYGAHAETAVAAPALTWYLAEGATHSGFQLFYLLQNPNTTAAEVRVKYLRPQGAALEKAYSLPPTSRTNIWVNVEEFEGLGRALAATDVSAVFEVQNDQPIIVERAMYFEVAGQTLGAGHNSAGVIAPATEWFLAEGATGPWFDLFVLIANPETTAALVEATFLRPDGTTLVKPYTIAPHSRFNIWVDKEDTQLADTAVSTTLRSTNGVPVIVERAMWWPGTGWYEAHNSPGATTTGIQWAVAEGEVNAARNLETYLLVANTSLLPADVRVTLLFEDGTSVAQTYAGIPAQSRYNVPVGYYFPEAAGKRFGALIESVGTTPAPIVVERAMFWDAAGQTWAAGTNALATRLR